MGGDDLGLEMEGGEDMLSRGQPQGGASGSGGAANVHAGATVAAPSRLDMNAATAAAAAAPHRNRSPTPPRALFRSTTGKGVAFTQEDVTFLVRFMEYRKSQGALDMVAFWKDVAAKASILAAWLSRLINHMFNFSIGATPLSRVVDEILAQTQA